MSDHTTVTFTTPIGWRTTADIDDSEGGPTHPAPGRMVLAAALTARRPELVRALFVTDHEQIEHLNPAEFHGNPALTNVVAVAP